MPSRARLAGQPLAKTVRIADLALIAATALLVLEWASPLPLVDIRLAGAAPLAIAALALVWALSAVKAYGFRPRDTFWRHEARIVLALALSAAIATAAGAAYFGVSAIWSLTGPWLAITAPAVALAHAAGWLTIRRLRKAGRLTANVLVVGTGRNAQRVIEGAMKAGDVAILGIFDDRAERGPRQVLGVPVLGDTDALMGHKVLPFVDKIVIAVPSMAQGRVRQLVDKLGVLPNPVTLVIDTDDTVMGQAVARISDTPLAYVSGKPNDAARAAVKRAQDLVIGGVGLIVAAPIMALTALAVRLDSPGPVFFRQRRHGFNNEEIVVWKFRSMKVESTDHTSARQVSADDDRITRVGKFIRKTSLDELPQILNVLTGEMSLVGPRPHAIGMKTGDVESARLVAEYAHRHRMKPGITGWAAIKGSRGPVDTPEQVRRRVALDVEYIERQSFWLDLFIIAMTIPCLLGDSETVR